VDKLAQVPAPEAVRSMVKSPVDGVITKTASLGVVSSAQPSVNTQAYVSAVVFGAWQTISPYGLVAAAMVPESAVPYHFSVKPPSASYLIMWNGSATKVQVWDVSAATAVQSASLDAPSSVMVAVPSAAMSHHELVPSERQVESKVSVTLLAAAS